SSSPVQGSFLGIAAVEICTNADGLLMQVSCPGHLRGPGGQIVPNRGSELVMSPRSSLLETTFKPLTGSFMERGGIAVAVWLGLCLAFTGCDPATSSSDEEALGSSEHALYDIPDCQVTQDGMSQTCGGGGGGGG